MNSQAYLDAYNAIFALYQKHHPEITCSDISKHAVEFAENFSKPKEINLNPIKPSWDNAPEWANWLAMDADGTWYWYNVKPIKDDDCWFIDDAGCVYSSIVLQSDKVIENNAIIFNWKQTLEHRPG